MQGNFDYQEPTEEQRQVVDEIRDAYKKLAELLGQRTKNSRYQSLAVTNLEQSCMWAKKAAIFEE